MPVAMAFSTRQATGFSVDRHVVDLVSSAEDSCVAFNLLLLHLLHLLHVRLHLVLSMK